MVPEPLVLDASAMIDMLVGAGRSETLRHRVRGSELHAPAHFFAEVLSALGRLHRGGHLTENQTTLRIDQLVGLPIKGHALPGLLAGTWRRRQSLRLVDALYVELATELGAVLITTDSGLAAAAPDTTELL